MADIDLPQALDDLLHFGTGDLAAIAAVCVVLRHLADNEALPLALASALSADRDLIQHWQLQAAAETVDSLVNHSAAVK